MPSSAWKYGSHHPGDRFFFNDTATTEIYTLSLHDALPIWLNGCRLGRQRESVWPSIIYASGRVESGDARRKPPRIQHLNTEAFAAGAAGLRVRIRELEPARDQLGGMVKLGSLQVERGPGVDEHLHPGRPDQDVATAGLGRKL